MDKKIRSCFLGRVSTILESQDSSLINQKNQMIDFISKQKNEIFDPDKDCFEDRISGTKIKKNNSSEQGFDKLMQLLGLVIEDTNSKDKIEITIKANRNTKPKYNKIYCKSTSRINRAGSKGQSLIEVLKELNVEVFFYDLQKSTFQMSQEELTLYSLFDNKYSRTMSFNTRNNKILKTQNRELMLHNERFGWDLVKKNNHRYYVKNENEYKAIRIMVKMFLEEDKGCSLIEEELTKKGYRTKRNTILDKSQINRILKDRHYIGEEKYYKYPKDYINQFCVDRDYLKNLDFQWLKCEYIEPLITEEEFNLIQDKFKTRSNTERGFRNPYTKISKILVCGCCEKHFYSLGKSNYFKINSYKCSSKRAKEKYNPCGNNTLYEDYLNQWLDKKAFNFPMEINNIYRENLEVLDNLKVYLALLMGDNDFDLFDNLTTREEQLTEEIEKLIEQKLVLSSNDIIDSMIIKRDNERKEVKEKIAVFLDSENLIKSQLQIVNNAYDKLLEKLAHTKSKYTREEYLDELEYIYIYPKKSAKRHRNSIILLAIYKVQNEIFNILNNIFTSDIIKLVEDNTFKIVMDKQNRKKVIIKEPTEKQKEIAKQILDKLE